MRGNGVGGKQSKEHAWPGTDLFTVVHCVGLQVVAHIVHDEKRGQCAHVLAPSVFFIEKPAMPLSEGRES